MPGDLSQLCWHGGVDADHETDVHMWYCKDHDNGQSWTVEYKSHEEFTKFPFGRPGAVPIGFFKGPTPNSYFIYYQSPSSK